MNLESLLQKSARDHAHLCPRQILGVRMGLAGLSALGFDAPPDKKRLLIIAETDGCFVDGVSAATNCTVGHRTLRIEDYGKTAAVFVDTVTGQAIRLAPALDIRQRAYSYADGESRHYFAQMQAYRVMPDDALLTIQPVQLRTSIQQIISRAGVRIDCEKCGEEIINEREVVIEGHIFCYSCALGGYYGPENLTICAPFTVATIGKE